MNTENKPPMPHPMSIAEQQVNIDIIAHNLTVGMNELTFRKENEEVDIEFWADMVSKGVMTAVQQAVQQLIIHTPPPEGVDEIKVHNQIVGRFVNSFNFLLAYIVQNPDLVKWSFEEMRGAVNNGKH